MERTNTEEADKASILALINNRIEATRNKDVDGALSGYSPDVLSFDVVDPLVYKGLDAIRKRLEEWFSTFRGDVGLEINDIKIHNSGDVAFCFGLAHVHATTIDGKTLDMWWRETDCLRKIKGKWMIIHIHSSVPFNMLNGKASLDLKPVEQI